MLMSGNGSLRFDGVPLTHNRLSENAFVSCR